MQFLISIPSEQHPIYFRPYLQFVKITLNSNLVLQHTHSPLQISVISKSNKHALIPFIFGDPLRLQHFYDLAKL